jgi:hypothetical protein
VSAVKTKPRPLNPAEAFKLKVQLSDLARVIERVPGANQRQGMAMRMNALAAKHGITPPRVR